MQSGNINDKVLYADARIGMQVETFLRSEVGRYLIGRAEIQEKEAIEELIDLDSWQWLKVRKARNKIVVARSLRDWLADAVQSGIAAGANLQAMEDESDGNYLE